MMTRRTWLWGLVLTIGGLGGWLLARPTLPTRADVAQSRFNQAAPVPQGVVTLAQTFTPMHAGLTALELLVVTYPDAAPTAAITLTLHDATGAVVAERVFYNPPHNQPLRLDFAPQPASAQQPYRLTLSGSPDNASSIWVYSLDGYPAGALWVAGVVQAGDARFSTFYAESAWSLGQTAFTQWAMAGLPLLVGWLVLFAPGLLLLDIWPWPTPLSAGARWGVALGLSVALGPLLWLWAQVVGWQWNAVGVGLVYGGLGLIYLARQIGHWRKQGFKPWDLPSRWLLVGLALTLTLRWLAVRDLAFPAWVDASHHYAIAQVLAAAGQVPTSYEPLYPIARFVYHFGFHALAVTVNWLTAGDLATTLLWFGQGLNALQIVGAYAGATLLTRRPWAGLGAAGLVGVVLHFPAYHATWGRYAHLPAMLLLAVALGATWQLLQKPYFSRVLIVVVGVSAAGLAVTHYPTLLLYAAFCGVALLSQRGQHFKWLLLAAGLALVLSGPWLWHLAQDYAPRLAARPTFFTAPPGDNAFPFDYFDRPLELTAWALAGVGLLWGLWRRERGITTLTLWLGAVLVVVNLGSGAWLLNNRLVAISLFLPLAVLGGWAGAQLGALWRWFNNLAQRTQSTRKKAVGKGLALLGLALGAGLGGWWLALGLVNQIAILNPETLLAGAADRAALTWVAQHTPENAVFAVNSWNWQNNIWAGSDGGAWLWPLTGRRSTLPPIGYVYQPIAERAATSAINEQLMQIRDGEDATTLALWQQTGITHIFIGARGGELRPEYFVNQPHYELLYTNGAAWVFAIRAAGP